MQGLGTSGDWKFLYQGQEYIDAFGYNSYDFHARGFDANLGRFDGADPIDNYGISNYAGMANNPQSYIDPDGRNPIIIGFMIGMFASAVSNMIKGTMPNNIGQFLAPGIVGAASAGVGNYVSGLTKAWGIVGSGIASGAAGGFVGGGLSSSLNGGKFFQGALKGSLWGGVIGGGMGLINLLSNPVNQTEYYPNSEPSESLPATDTFLDEYSQKNFGLDYHRKFGIKTLSTENIKLPQGYKLEDGLMVSKEGVQIGGITVNHAFRSSDIFISPKVFSYGEYSLFNTVGHEFIHAYHRVIGLDDKFGSKNLGYTEYKANMWSSEVSDNYRQCRGEEFYLQNANRYLKKGTTVPVQYNIPSWFPSRYK